MDPEFLFPDPAKYEKQINKIVISQWFFDFVYCRTGRFLLDSSFSLIFEVFFLFPNIVYLNFMVCIRMDPELFSWMKNLADLADLAKLAFLAD